MRSEGYIVLFGFILAIVWMSNRHKERRDRLRVIEQALRNGSLTPEQQQMVSDELAGRRSGSGVPILARLAFVCGWIGLFVGGGFLVYEELQPYDRFDYDTVGLLVMGGSFGVLSLPIALREFERKHPGRGRG